MNLLSPFGLLWLGAIPVLLWLWRLASTHRHVQVPSLIPFEHLVKRQARRRHHLAVNALFWLQLLALIGAAIALAGPVLLRPQAKTTLVVLDASASMAAGGSNGSIFERAKQAVLTRVVRKAGADQFLIVASAPVSPLTPQPTADPVALTRALDEAHTVHLAGNLTSTLQIGRSLLGIEPDQTIVVTDEPQPDGLPPESVRWIGLGEPLSNTAIVGLDAQGSLCTPSDARVIVTVQNFSESESMVRIAATQGDRRLAETQEAIAPGARRSVSLALSEATEGWTEVSLTAHDDRFDVDNHAWIELHRGTTLPVLMHLQAPALNHAIARWLSACQAVTWITDAESEQRPYVLMTDQAQEAATASVATMLFTPPAQSDVFAAHWVVAQDHPIGSYLAPVVVVSAALDRLSTTPSSGVPVISGIVNGQRIPVLVADERDGRRLVTMHLDPSKSVDSIPLTLAFFNSLRWLRGEAGPVTTGEPMTVNLSQSGTVRIQRPDGSVDLETTETGALRYDATTLAGLYRFSIGGREVVMAVNFLDPLESDLLHRVSTWRAINHESPTAAPPRTATYPLSNLVILAILGLVLLEWWRYSSKRGSVAALHSSAAEPLRKGDAGGRVERAGQRTVKTAPEKVSVE